MEHRLRRKHMWLNCNTNASNEMCLKEKQEKKEETFRSSKKQEMKRKRNEQHGSGVTLKWAFPKPTPVHRHPKNRIFTEGNRHFCNWNCSTIFFWFWRLLGQLKKEKKKEKEDEKKEK